MRAGLVRFGVALVVPLLVLAPASVALPINKVSTHPAQARRLVTYAEEGGLVLRRHLAVLFSDRTAAVTTGSCGMWFRLKTPLWKRLTAALKGTDMHALAGAYPPFPGSADYITYVFTVGHDTVRITSTPRPEDETVRQKLKRLSTALAEVVTASERRMPEACGTTHA